MMNEFECKKCGQCCNTCFNTIKATHEDIERWEKQGRTDILQYIALEPIDLESCMEYGMIEMFVEQNVCPFLKKIRDSEYICTIHDTKPTFCKNYPQDDICERMKQR